MFVSFSRTRFISGLIVLSFSVALLYSLYPSHYSHAVPLYLIDPLYGILEPLPLDSRPKFAIATFLSHDSTRNWDESDFENDQWFIGTRILAYQLLYANETRLRDPTIPFVVLVTPTVSRAKRQQLILDGCTLVEVDTPPLPDWLPPDDSSVAADNFAKLRLFSLVQYDRILYLSPTTMLTRPIDPIFDDATLRPPSSNLASSRPEEVKLDEAPLPANYVFAARSDNALANSYDPYKHNFPPQMTDTFASFTLLFAPSMELYALTLSALHSARSKAFMSDFYSRKYSHRWTKNTGPEHALLNYIFRREGTMPWKELDPHWSSNWGSQRDVDEKVVSVSGEYWSSGPKKVRGIWAEWKGMMEAEFA